MKITLNGNPTDTDATTLAELLADRAAVLDERPAATPAGLPEGHAVAVDGEVVPRSAHRSWALVEGSVVEVVTAVAGG